MSQGHSFESFAAISKCARRTLFDWVDRHPEFKNAKEIAVASCQLFWEKLGLDLCRGDLKGNVTSFIWMSRNILGWRDNRNEIGNTDQPINIQIVKDSSTKEAG
jgi:hypothetical protein